MPGAADARNHESIVHEIGFLVEEDGEQVSLVPSWHKLPDGKEIVLSSPSRIPKHCVVELREVFVQ